MTHVQVLGGHHGRHAGRASLEHEARGGVWRRALRVHAVKSFKLLVYCRVRLHTGEKFSCSSQLGGMLVDSAAIHMRVLVTGASHPVISMPHVIEQLMLRLPLSINYLVHGGDISDKGLVGALYLDDLFLQRLHLLLLREQGLLEQVDGLVSCELVLRLLCFSLCGSLSSDIV